MSRWTITHRAASAPAVHAVLDHGPDRAIDAGIMLKNGDRCTVVQIRAADGTPVVLKRYNLNGVLHTASHLGIRSRAEWCWRNADRLCAAGLPAAEPLLCAQEHTLDVLRLRSCLVTRHVPGQSMLDLATSGHLRGDRLHAVARQFADIWHGLGQLGLIHRDMKATNFIIDEAMRIWLIDLDGMRRPRTPFMFRRGRRADWNRFMRNWRDLPEVAAAFRAQIDTA